MMIAGACGSGSTTVTLRAARDRSMPRSSATRHNQRTVVTSLNMTESERL